MMNQQEPPGLTPASLLCEGQARLDALFRNALPSGQAKISQQLVQLVEKIESSLIDEIPEPELSLQFLDLPTKLYTDKCPAFRVVLLDQQMRQFDLPNAGVRFSLLDANGRSCDDDLTTKDRIRSRRFANGVIEIEAQELKITKVSAKRGGFVRLCAHLDDPRTGSHPPLPPVRNAQIEVKVISKPPIDKSTYTPSMSVAKMKHVGPATFYRLKTCEIRTVADLATLSLPEEDREEFERVLFVIRKKRGRMTPQKFRSCILDARECVFKHRCQNDLSSSDDSPTPSLAWGFANNVLLSSPFVPSPLAPPDQQ